MDADQFQKALIVVLIGGSVAVAIGTSLLYLAFRSVGRTRYFLLMGALLAFLFVCCFVLFTISFSAPA
jgi:hypothetical protein